MTQVSKEEEKTRTVVTVAGQISVECIELLETRCHQAIAAAKHCLVLREPIVDLLKRLAERGVAVTARGIYTSYIVQVLQLAAVHAPSSSPLQAHR